MLFRRLPLLAAMEIVLIQYFMWSQGGGWVGGGGRFGEGLACKTCREFPVVCIHDISRSVYSKPGGGSIRPLQRYEGFGSRAVTCSCCS